ncbi:hypothetical protein L873DRAFT_1390243 [Choiromyces venosus 120613-1]|uniref:F-box domain-containing protein n=1 Tax=Choiromyces venosus 120613-1 TaxID=1336337 RepID=A0A3N4JDZ5_9PEZI|nr:hypothetical protein L873DRAFT_1390243 [Choiromyces venosus 120613-1]
MDEELSRFRQQWQAEVSARHHQPPASSSSQPSSSANKPKQNPFASRKLSHSSTDEGVEDEPPELSAQRPPSPIAHRTLFASSSSRADLKSALEHYELAVEKESEGNLGESLSLYRKAFRLDHKVDSHYREKHFPRPPPSSAKKKTTLATIPSSQQLVPPSAPAPAPASLASGSKEMSELIASFAGVQIQPASVAKLDGGEGAIDKGKGKKTKTEEEGIEEEQGVSPLATLPSELLLQIVRNVALTDVASFAKLAQVCKAFAYLVIMEQSIWRAVCEKTFDRMLWDWEVAVNGDPIEKPLQLEGPNGEVLQDGGENEDEEEQKKREVPVDETELLKYGGSWRKMFMIRPRVRFNGIYISTCNYVRAGASQSWNTPVYIVTYYRYLRFYPNGTVLSLLSSCEPAEVVHGFNEISLTPAHLGGLPVGTMSWGKYVSKGRWRIDKDGQLDVETEAPMMEKYLFRMALKVKSIRAGGRTGGVNKLVWEGFWSWNIISDDLAEFSLKNDKPFFFSRVGSIEREMGYV